MRILADENIPNITIHELRAQGHDVLDIRGTEQQGMFDDELWPFAQTERRTLVTTERATDSYPDHGCFPPIHGTRLAGFAGGHA